MKKENSDFWLWVTTIIAIGFIFADLVLILFSNGNLIYLPRELNISDTANFWAQRGQWGDMLSGHFAAMAFILLFYTAMLQRRELKEMRAEATQQTAEFKTQTTYMKYDRLFNQLRQYIDGIYIKRGVNEERIKGYSALSEILDKDKRPLKASVNFSHIKTLIVAYINVVLFLNAEDEETKSMLSKELAIVISTDDIKLLWKLYVCNMGMDIGYTDIDSRTRFIEEKNKKMLQNESLNIWYQDVKGLLNRSETPDNAFKNLYKELEG